MGAWFAVEVEALRRAAGVVSAAGERVGQLAPADALVLVRAGMPGAASVATVAGGAAVWHDRWVAWPARAREHAQAMHAAADGYEASEADAVRAFTRADRRAG